MKLRWLDPILIHVVPLIAAAYSCIVGFTSSQTIVAPEYINTKQKILEYKKFIACVFHSRLFYFSYWARGENVFAMVSNSKDGKIISRTIQQLRLNTIRGSSSKGGHEAMIEGLELLEQQEKIFITPDGPRGPRHQVKPGIIRMAQLSGAPIVPFGCSSTAGIFLPSWDRFFLPFPFGKVVITTGDLMYIPPELTQEEFEQKRLSLEKIMNDLSDQADLYCGRNPETEVRKMWKKAILREEKKKASKQKSSV